MSLAIEPMPNDQPHPTGMPPSLSNEDSTLESIADTVGYAASALEGLRDVLERLNGSVARAQEESSAETRLGQLFTRAQEFLESVIADARQHATQILRDAEDDATRVVSAGTAEAERLVAEAKAEAQRLLDDAKQHSGLHGEALKQFETTIATFNRVNAELIGELAALQRAIAADEEPNEDPLQEAVPADESFSPPADAGAEVTSSTDEQHRTIESELHEPEREAPDASSPTAQLSGSWMHADSPLWETPTVYREPRRRFWRRQP